MVLVWTLLMIIGNRILYDVMDALNSQDRDMVPFLIQSTGISVIVVAPFIGWLADAKLGTTRL